MARNNQIQTLLLPVLLSIRNELLSGHSELDPRLPIPNRTVKRLSADDSADYPRESRTPLGALSEKALLARAFSFSARGRCADLLSVRNREGVSINATNSFIQSHTLLNFIPFAVAVS